MNFGRKLKKALKRNDLATDIRNVERHRPRQATAAAADPIYAHAQHSDAQPSDGQSSYTQPPDAQPGGGIRVAFGGRRPT